MMHKYLTSRTICPICPLVTGRTIRVLVTKPQNQRSNNYLPANGAEGRSGRKPGRGYKLRPAIYTRGNESVFRWPWAKIRYYKDYVRDFFYSRHFASKCQIRHIARASRWQLLYSVSPPFCQ
jgi:hypothetical protein